MIVNPACHTGRFLAMPAALVLAFWPPWIGADCGCHATANAAAVPGAASSGTPTPTTCCATSLSQDDQDCGRAEAIPVVEIGVPGSATTLAQPDGDDCQCAVKCCRQLGKFTFRTAYGETSPRGGQLPAEAAAEFPNGILIASSDPVEPLLLFLPAQAHCARICCWLK